MKKVITYGTFDLLHYGHINLFKRAKDLGDYLIVAVSTDDFNLAKGKKSYLSYDERVKLVKSIKYVDEVIREESWDQKKYDILNRNIEIFCIGDDWDGKFNYLENICNVIYLKRTENISSTMIKGILK